MRIVCDYTGVALEATLDVAEMLIGRGFTAAERTPAPLATPPADTGNTPAPVKSEPPALSTLDGDSGQVSAVIDAGVDAEPVDGQAPVAASVDPAPAPAFVGWEVSKEFLKEREIAELRAYAAANGVELPRPANKGQIVNAIVAALAG